MTKIAILSDTTQDLTFELGNQFGIEIIPYQVQLSDKHYKDQIDIDAHHFYQVMQDHDVISTGVPPIQDVMDKVDQLIKEGYEDFLVLTSSAKLTGMRQLYEIVKNDFTQVRMEIFDTETVASASGLLAVYAAELREAGKNLDQIIDRLEAVRPQARIFAIFRTIKYVIKGGRMNKYAGMIGSFLNINPLLTIKDQEINILNKARGKKKSYQALLEAIKKEIGQSKVYKLVIWAADNAEEIQTLQEDLKAEIQNAQTFIVTELTPVLGVHAGPEAIGASVLRLD